MKLSLQSPGKALNKAYLKEKVGRAEIEVFKSSFLKMLSFDETEPNFSSGYQSTRVRVNTGTRHDSPNEPTDND